MVVLLHRNRPWSPVTFCGHDLAGHPDSLSSFLDLLDPGIDLPLSDRTHGMINDYGFKVWHAEGSSGQLSLPHELGGDDGGRRNTELFECDRIPDTARATRAAVPDGGEHDVVLSRNLFDQLRCGVLGEALLHVIVHSGKLDVLAECGRCTAEELVGVPFRVIEDAKAQTFKFRLARGNRGLVLVHEATWIEHNDWALFVLHGGLLHLELAQAASASVVGDCCGPGDGPQHWRTHVSPS